MMGEIFKHILTGKDNQTHDIAKWAWMLGFVLVGCSAIYLIYTGKEIGNLAKLLESKFALKAIISIEFEDISEEERKNSGLADAKLLPIPGKH